jgi:multicomponent Na+:H+ antiporter subunit D
MTPEWVHPGLVLVLGAWVLPLLRGRIKRAALVLLPAAALVLCLVATPGTHGVVQVLGQDLVFGRVDATSLLFACVFALMTCIGMVFALHVEDDARHIAALTYAGSALGVTFAGDLLSLYVFWELMAVASTLLVWQGRQPSAVAAGFRYLLVHLVGGLVLLAGIVLHFSETGSLAFGDLGAHSGSLAWCLILVAFLLNAAVPPLGAWLPDAYAEATVTGAVFMTAFTTKSAVYALIRGFAGTELLVWLGAIMAVYGVVYAVLENDARRLLAYHIISQVGYMVCGVGIGTDLAINGAAAHAFAHILYKALLFMGAGAVLHTTGLRKLSEMGGLYRTMPMTLGLYMVGAFAISAVPLFSGFVSKSMVVSAAGETHRALVFLTLTLASAGTFLHTGLKLPYYMFFGKRSERPPERRGAEPPANMLAAMGLAAAACILIGVFPGVLYRFLPNPVDYAPYTLQHVTSTLGLLSFTGLGFFLLLEHLDPEPTISLDTDWFYRRGAAAFTRAIQRPLARFESGTVGKIYELVMRRPVLGMAGLLRRFDSLVVDSALVGLARSTQSLSRLLKTAASGHAQHYGLLMTAGFVALVALAILAR